MTRLETPFVIHGDLIIVETFVAGPRGRLPGRFVLDTGAVFTTMIPELADLIGYSPRDGVKRTRVHTAVGEEEGYLLHVTELAVLGYAMTSFPVHVFDLGHASQITE
jgi:predicted aspartyl protease